MRRTIAILVAALAAAVAPPASASFPGENGRIAFLLTNEDGFVHIWTAMPDGSDRRQLTGGEYSTWDEAWSPDGRRLVYSTDRYASAPPPDPGFRVDVVVRDMTSGEERLLTPGGINEQPSFSADGSRIVFALTGADGAGRGIFTMRAADGGDVRRLTGVPAGAAFLQSPRLSANGEMLAFAGARHPRDGRPGSGSPSAGITGALYVADADGEHVRRITAWGTRGDSQVDWSPDSSRLVFETEWGRSVGPDLFVVNPDGTGLRDLTDDPNLTPSKPFRASFDPTWSPDGSTIAFNCAPGTLSFWDLCTIHPDGTGRTLVASTDGDEDTPAWQPLPGRLAR